MTPDHVNILCSGVALGVYVPALLLEQMLRRRGLATGVVVLENLLQAERKARLRANKAAFHADFAVALAGQKLARDLRPAMDDAQVEALFQRWDQAGATQFIVFSGFWLPVVEAYQERTRDRRIRAELCFMDAAISASWRLFHDRLRAFPQRTLFDGVAQRILCTFPFFTQPDTPWDRRPERYVIHGGGWGMGTYKDMIPELELHGLPLDIIAYEATETTGLRPDQSAFMVDPRWDPWDQDAAGRHVLPPFGEVRAGAPPVFHSHPEHHGLFDVVRQARAVISKPGGATLLDSLASATPLVTLAPFGDYERKNAELWHHLGLGISYEDWRASGFAPHPLEACHHRLVQIRSETPDYVDLYLRDIRGAGGE